MSSGIVRLLSRLIFRIAIAVVATHAIGSPTSACDTSATEQIELGKALFERSCVACHGVGGTGGRGPNLNRRRLARAPDDTSLRALIENGIPPEMPEGSFFTDQDVTNLSCYIRSLGDSAPRGAVGGDPTRGAAIYVRSGCPACHIFAGVGASYGPDLTDVGERRSSDYMREAILQPAKRLPAGFLMVKAMTRAGDVIQGVRVNEDTFTVQIRTVTGQFYSFRKSELKELQKLEGETPMPPFAGVLTPGELQDVVAYLESPRLQQ